MAKQGGMGMQLLIDGYSIGGDTQQVDKIGAPLSTLEFTDITQFAHERQIGLRDGSWDTTHYFNAAVGRAHAALSTLPTTDRISTLAIPASSALVIGDAAASMIAKQLNYDATRAADGSFLFKVSASANGYGMEWGQLLTAGQRSDTTATNGSSLDGAASSAFGAQAWLQVVSFTGTSVAIKIQDSADNSAWADLASGAFASVSTAPQAQRIATGTATVRRYLRVITSGTFSQCTFMVHVTRNATAVTF